MTTLHRWPRAALIAAALTWNALSAVAADPTDETAIRQVILSTWDKPEARVEVGPVVVAGNRAVAGWTQGQRGGRALMARDQSGHWAVAACGGDSLKDAKTLQSSGMSAAEARQISASLAKAESAVPAARRALFSTFDGLMRMDAAGHAASGGRP
ncbi:copper uptake system-associated protein [Sphingomonas sp. NCPPB 2930]